ncbi:MAG: Uma2 family endonuclease [Chloroflexota bacterium]
MVEQTRTGITLDELVSMGDEWVEIIDGERVQLNMAAGLQHNHIAVNVHSVLKDFVRANKLGSVHMDGLTYVIAVEDDTVEQTRLPDVSFIRSGRITKDMDISKPFVGAPDLAIEVTSPGQTAETLRQRVRDYLEHGSQQVWVLYVASEEVYTYDSKSPGQAAIYTAGQTFTSALFPGLTVRVDDLFDLSELFE